MRKKDRGKKEERRKRKEEDNQIKSANESLQWGYSQTFVIWAEKKKDLSNDNLENNNKKMHFSGLDQNQAEQSRAANS
ncbi:hypothetical protein TYRP_022285 [Tyrophagus putrescentiae]|nr:hypothetical protein TYRP_022285 [Tyrophagus putrescentiae]